jgi:squalene-associated FAD-dependent desaturase
MQIAPDEDISVRALLHSQAQTPALMRKLWEPLCIAILNTPAQIASARLFIGVLRILVAGIRRHADLLIPRRELGALFPRPAGEYLELHGAHVELGQRVTGLEIDEHGVRAVQVGSRRIPCSQLILATPHVISRRLLAHHPALQALGQRLTALAHEPVTTVYLQYPPETRLPIPMVGFEDAVAQWVFDRRVCNQPGLMAVVISTRGEHMQLPAEGLTAQVAADLAGSFPRWPAYRHARVLREKRATFSARAGIDAVRPGNRTVVPGLWLAGDYTATGLPATLEGAVRSGEACAKAVFDVLQD